MLFDQAMEGIVAPVMVAMASAFSPFPERSAPFAALAKSVEYGNGIVVSAHGHIVTDRKLSRRLPGDPRRRLGDADRIADDKDNGLALLRVYGARKLTPLALDRTQTAKPGDLTLVGIPDPNEQMARKTLDRDQGAAGRRQLDRIARAGADGRIFRRRRARRARPLLGMMEMRSFVLASTEPAAPPVRLIPAETMRDFLAAHDVPPRKRRRPMRRRRWCG